MENYKEILADGISKAVGAELVLFEENDYGFFCDYDIPPLNPITFAEIVKKVNSDNIECVFELDRFSGVYEDGKAKNRMLQRIYVLAFRTPKEIEAYKSFVAEAVKRDHKTLGNE